MAINRALFMSNKDDWETPRELFESLDAEFHFTLDAASSDANALCEKHFTIEDDGLKQSWQGETVWCNPPYGRQIRKWIQKADDEAKNGTTTVMLIPARTDTKWFRDFVYGKYEIRFIRGRLYYCVGGVPYKWNAAFPSMLVIFKKTTD